MGNRSVVWMKFGLVFVTTVAVLLAQHSANVAAQADPSSLPLLSSGGLHYVGGFRVPAQAVNGDNYAGGGGAIAFNPANNSLFVSSYYGNVAEISIPAPVNASDPSAMPFASFLQPFADPTEGRVNEATFGYGGGISSLLVYNNRLYGTAQIYYDSSNEQRVSHYSRSLQLNQQSFSGWSQVWEATKQGYVSGFLAAVPSEWQARLGGAALAGQCCIPIVSRTSFGPSAFGFNPTQVGSPTVPAAPLLYYDGAHQTLGEYLNVTTPNETYNQSTEIHGMVVVAGTRTVLYIGRNGLGVPCYGNGTSNKSLVGTYGPDGALYCYDLDQFGKGVHAWPYRYQIWAYDLNDLAAVRAGTKQPWDVVPYGVWPLNLPTPGNEIRLGGASYDPERQLLYVSQRLADFADLSYRPIIHVFQLDAAAAPRLSGTTVSSVSMSTDKVAPQSAGTTVNVTAQPTGGVAPYQYKWLISDGSTTTVAANWTTANRYTWTPTAANANYRVSVWVRSAGNTADAFEASASIPFAIGPSTTSGSATAVNLAPNMVPPQAPFTPITWTASAVGGVAPHQYKWLVFDGTIWTVAANWATTNSFTWTPGGPNPNYQVGVWVRSAGKTTDFAEATSAAAFPIESSTSGTGTVSSVALTSNLSAPQPVGSAITWTATPSDGTAPFVYKWLVSNGGDWTTAVNWTSSATFTWTPTAVSANYRVAVWVKGATTQGNHAEASAERGFAITAAGAGGTTPIVSQVTLTADKVGPQAVGVTVAFSAQAVGGTAPYQYQWWIFDGKTWRAASAWGSSNTFNWTPTRPDPKYQIAVWARSAGSVNTRGEATAALPFVINNGNGR